MEEENNMKNRTFNEYWLIVRQSFKPIKGFDITNEGFFLLKGMCRNAYNAGLREGKKKRPRAVKP